MNLHEYGFSYQVCYFTSRCEIAISHLSALPLDLVLSSRFALGCFVVVVRPARVARRSLFARPIFISGLFCFRVFFHGPRLRCGLVGCFFCVRSEDGGAGVHLLLCRSIHFGCSPSLSCRSPFLSLAASARGAGDFWRERRRGRRIAGSVFCSFFLCICLFCFVFCSFLLTDSRSIHLGFVPSISLKCLQLWLGFVSSCTFSFVGFLFVCLYF
jgi:hypothetical protein